MLKVCLILGLALSVFLNVTYSFSMLNTDIISSDVLNVLKNATITRDGLNKALFEIIENFGDVLFQSGDDFHQYDALKCVAALREIRQQFPSLTTAPFFDSWGKFPSGLLYGNVFDIGNYDECVETSVTLSKSIDPINGQYCLATIPIFNQTAVGIPMMPSVMMPIDQKLLGDAFGVILGICIPDSCSPTLLTSLLKQASISALSGLSASEASVNNCSVAKKPAFTALDIFAMFFFCLIAGLMLASSVYEIWATYFEKQPKVVLLAFSMFTNGRKLFAINNKRTRDTIACLNGIRGISMMWITYQHVAVISILAAKMNTIHILSWIDQPWSMHLLNSTVSVDTFLFMSGLLVAYLGLQELDRTKGKPSVFFMPIHRYIRLTIPLAALLLYVTTVDKFIGSGPFREHSRLINSGGCNKDTVWPILLYIQNYFKPKTPPGTMCIPQSWYLAIDFQLFVLSPIFIMGAWKWGKKFVPVLVVLLLMSIGYVMATYFIKGYTDLSGLRDMRVYMSTYTRCSPWLVGFGLGYLMHNNRQTNFDLPKILQLFAWTMSLVVLAAILYGPYFMHQTHDRPTVFEAAMNESLRRVSWAIALAWITFACHYGFGGIVDAILSHPLWQPLARLSYSLYLVHVSVALVNSGITRAVTHFSQYDLILNFVNAFGISLVVSVPVVLAFEFPALALEKIIFAREKEKVPLNGVRGTHHSNVEIVDFSNKDVR